MKRPLSVTLISWLFIVAGIAGIIYHTSDWKNPGEKTEVIWAFVVRLLAIVGGVFALRDSNWARWLLVAWIAYHVVLSFYHTTAELAMHALLMIVVLLALFNRKANVYFKS